MFYQSHVRTCGGIYAMVMSFCLLVSLSHMKFVKSFARWQHLAASGIIISTPIH